MLESVKKLLGLDGSSDEILILIIDLTEKRLCALLNCEDVPEALRYIVTEVSVARYNKIGSEGLSSHSVEGETMNWADDDFSPYQSEMEAWQKSNTKAGKVRFL